MQQRDSLLAGHPASLEHARERALANARGACHTRLPASGGEIVDLSARLKARERERPQDTADRICAERILRAFNTWAFKREQPSDIDLMLNVICHANRRAQPLSFALYWGKGPRCSLAHPDIECLDYLCAFSDRVKQSYARGAVLNLIFTDTHAELNGHPELGIWSYFYAVHVEARARGFHTCALGELVRAAKALPVTNEEPIEEATLDKLIVSARKWYRGPGSPEDGARQYYRMNMVERRAVEAAFPNSMFITFNGSDLRALFPQHMPIFYMYSLRRGFGVKPWFLPLDARACTAASCACAQAQT